VGITIPFVYPILAFLPIVSALAFGPALYPTAWLGIVTALNALAFAVLIRSGAGAGASASAGAGAGADDARAPAPRLITAAWWWLGFLLLLGPIALARIDSVTVPLVIMALLQLAARPLWGTVLLTIATWVKVWPAAVIAALFVASRRRWRVLAIAAGTSAVIVALALLAGSGRNVFSFVTQQTTRGIQIESPVSLIWLWQTAFGVPGNSIYYDRQLLTYQVAGPGVDVAAELMTPLLALGVAAVLLLGVIALRRGARFERLFPPLVLALVVTLIAFNKVGSPQFIAWLVAPVILGLVTAGVRAWRTPAVMVLVLATLTQVVYPYWYDWLLVANPLMLTALTARNLLEFVLLGWAIHGIWTARTRHL
jgi:preprotein translocase subunit SecG